MSARIIAILGLIALLSTSACAAARNAVSQDQGRTQESTAPRAVPPAAPAAPGVAAAPPAPAPAQRAAANQPASGGAAAPAADQAQQSVPNLDRMIIRTVTMTLAVTDVPDAFHKVEQIVSQQRGYLAGTQIRQDGDRQIATMTIRVPADQATYQATLEQLRGISERVVDEQSQAQDVTEQYVDIDARLRTLKASEENLLQLLAKAQKIDDNLQIQRELTNVRTQIEQIQSQKQSLERRADMATINLTLRESVVFIRPGWSPGGTFEEAVRALGSALRGLTIAAIWIAVFSPIWGGALVILWLLLRGVVWLARRSDRRPAGPRGTPPAAPTAPSEPAAPTAPSGPAAPAASPTPSA
ncbi:MAG: DUF4349 domain-containing protein [Chloroflexota bacterium]